MSALRVAKVNNILVTAGKYYGLARKARDRGDVCYYSGRTYVFYTPGDGVFFFFFREEEKSFIDTVGPVPNGSVGLAGKQDTH